MLAPVSSLLRLASIVICLITVASFGLFVTNQTKSASAHQQEVLNETAPTEGGSPSSGATGKSVHHESSVHRVIDEASEALTSPFSGITAGSSSEWVIHGVGVALALLVYGFGLGFLVRVIRPHL
jgi:hypothetical protein